ncbi:MAG: TolC family protein [Bacteroidales bacterium]|nr:TolC family protein [Bacteroidales bacterium]
MKNKTKLIHLKTVFPIMIILMINNVFAQNSINEVLLSVEANNKAIISNQNLWESNKIENKVGLLPDNPSISYGYFPGNTSDIGIKRTFGIHQSFDFPTVYFKKNNLIDEQLAYAGFQMKAFRQNILLEAKLVCYELVFLNKLKKKYEERLVNASKLLEAYKTKFQNGDANILDLNKAELQFVEFDNNLRSLESEIMQYSEKLILLNGEKPIEFTAESYSDYLPEDFDKLLSVFFEKSPLINANQSELEIANSRLKLSRSLYLPEIELSYESEMIMDDSYRGVKVGLSIPLWGKTNTIKSSKANQIFMQSEDEKLRAELSSLIKQDYQKLLIMKTNLDNYSRAIETYDNIKLLRESLDEGQISAIEYFMEITYFYNIYDNFLNLEKDYYQKLAGLYKFAL